MSGLRVVEAHSAALRKAFSDLPYRLYRRDAAWVAPLVGPERRRLDPRHNPFSSHGVFQPMVALRGDRVVGRILALDDRAYNLVHGTHHGFFGLFESEDDEEVVAALLSAATDWCKTRGADLLLGPMNFSTNDSCGLLVDGFGEPPTVNLAHTSYTYPELFDRCGMRKAWDYLAFKLPVDREPSGSVLHFAEAVRRSHRVLLRHPERHRYDEELDRLMALYNQAWAQNIGFVPMSAEEATAAAAALRPLLRPELILLAEVDRALVGFCVAVPDINEALKPLRGRLLSLGLPRCLSLLSRIQAVRICSLGVLPAYARAGLPSLFYVEMIAIARRLGYRFVELSLVLETNETMTHGIEALGGVPYKRWRIYQRPIEK